MKNDILKNNAIRSVISEMAEVAGYLWQRGWAERNAGNISVNITGLLNSQELVDIKPLMGLQERVPSMKALRGEVFLVTGTGTRMRDVAKNPKANVCILIIDENLRISSFSFREKRDALRPTSEIYTHLAVQQMLLQRDGVHKVVLHAHVNEFIALTQIKTLQRAENINEILWGMLPEVVMFCPKGTGFIKYSLPGTKMIALKTVNELTNHDVVIWGKHGCISTAPTLSEAFDNIELLAKSAGIYLLCRNAGFEPEGFSAKELNQIRTTMH